MTVFTARRFSLVFLTATLLSLLVSCGGGGGSGPSVPSTFNVPVTLNLTPFNDPWPASSQRMQDIDDRTLDDFIARGFTYNAGQLSLTYDSAPDTPYFVGRVRARGLKPNFCYQLKLAGKPADGPRGWKAFADDTTNERIGSIGRWWCDSEQMNVNDAHFNNFYRTAPAGSRHTVYGYQLMAIFVTDGNGDADVAFDGSGSFHVTWQDKQNKYRDYDAGTFTIATASPYYGYGRAVPPASVRLWLEREAGRPVAVRLPPGRYNCRLLITEESFHNNFGGTNSTSGGFWRTVLASEDFSGGSPDGNAANDIVFNIK